LVTLFVTSTNCDLIKVGTYFLTLEKYPSYWIESKKCFFASFHVFMLQSSVYILKDFLLLIESYVFYLLICMQ